MDGWMERSCNKLRKSRKAAPIQKEARGKFIGSSSSSQEKTQDETKVSEDKKGYQNF